MGNVLCRVRRLVAIAFTLPLAATAGLVFSDHSIAQVPDSETRSDSSGQSEWADSLEARWRRVVSGQAQLGDTAGTPPAAAAGGIHDPALPPSPEPRYLDDDTRAKYLEALSEYYLYRKESLQHRRAVFRWQLFSSKVIFVAVLLLVLAGVYFAAVQFHTGLARGDGETDGKERTELAASIEGIKVGSPVLGVVILVISLAFYYLYLIYVYPIEDVF